MKFLEKSFSRINTIKYKTYKNAKTILFEASGVNSPKTMVAAIFFTSFFKEEGYNVHALGSRRKVAEYKYIDSTSDKFIPFKSYIQFLKHLPRVLFLHLLYFNQYIKPEKLFHLEVDGIYIGDAIYDEYLRYNQLGTIKKFDWKLFLKISEAFYYYAFFKSLYKKHDYEYVVTNHHCYIRQLIMNRMAISSGIKVIQNQALVVVKKLYDMETLSNEHISQPNNDIIKSVYSDNNILEKISVNSEVKLERNGGIDYYKNVNDPSEFILNIRDKKNKENKKLVVIYAHAYTDNITGADGRKFVFMDHYLWIKNTLLLCEKNKNIITILKSHPAEKNYISDITSEVIFKEVQNEVNSKDLILCPDDIDLKKYSDMIDLVITSRGTVGIEMPCLGVPVLAQVENHAVFSNNDVVIESKGYDDYANTISKAHLIPRLTEEEIKKAVAFAKLSNILVFYKRDNMIATWQDVLRKPDKLISVFDEGISMESVYRDDIDTVIENKLIDFEVNYKKDFFMDMKEFLNNDKIKYLAEVNYEEKIKEIIY